MKTTRSTKLVVIDESDQIVRTLHEWDDHLRVESIQPSTLTSSVQDHTSFDDALIVVLNHSHSNQEVEGWVKNIRHTVSLSTVVRIVDEGSENPLPVR